MLMTEVPPPNVDGQRRLLALDGGGIRGVITLEVLAEMENMLRREYHRDDVVLADYFDYFAGTSTGAMIAAGLALGWPVERLMRIYTERGPQMFDSVPLIKRAAKFFGYRFSSEGLAAAMREEYGADTSFGDANFKSLLMAVMHNVTTDSPWPLSNNPHAKYNTPSDPGSNLRLPLWEVVRASTAAPLFYPPEPVTVDGHRFIFIDGAVTPYNNPAFQLYVHATIPEYRLEWPQGADKLLLVSVGTGLTPKPQPDLEVDDMNVVHSLRTLPATLMGGSVVQQDINCRVVGRCIHADPIDSEVDALKGRANDPNARFTYVRYNAELTADGLESLGLQHLTGPKTLTGLGRVAGVKYINELREVGRAVATQVSPGTYSNFVGVAG